MGSKNFDENNPPDPHIPPEEILELFTNELRSSISSLKGFAELLAGRHGEISPSDQAKFAEIILKQADFISRTLRDVQEYLVARKTLE